MTELTCSEPDELHERLRQRVDRRVKSYLWVPGDTPAFRPALLPLIYGDGRALFALTTINQRPRYWVIRGGSEWTCGENDSSLDFGDLVDDMFDDLKNAFGRGRCGYCGNSLFSPRRERMKNCQCEECSDTFIARWPAVDDDYGCSWDRMDWPKGFPVVPNPMSRLGNFLALGAGT